MVCRWMQLAKTKVKVARNDATSVGRYASKALLAFAIGVAMTATAQVVQA